jgi:hypothetical protein
MQTELFSTENAFRAALTPPIPICASETLPSIDLACLRLVSAGDSGTHSTINDLGTALRVFGVILVKLSPDDFPLWDRTVLDDLLVAEAFDRECSRIFSNSSALHNYYREPPPDGAETAFYSFPLNSYAGGVRGNEIGDAHAGLPRSLIWNHNAIANPPVTAFADSQRILQNFIRLYRDITDVLVEALSIYFGDRKRFFRALVGAQTHHRANHLKLIHSPGATIPEELEEDRSTQMICRHRAHIDHCIFTLNPPTKLDSPSGGEFYYLSTRCQQLCWRPLIVPSFHVAIFGGVDIVTFTRGTSQQMRGLPHQVLATQPQALKARNSVLYRVTVNPDASCLRTLHGHPFSFHGISTPTGLEYYKAVFKHRQGY